MKNFTTVLLLAALLGCHTKPARIFSPDDIPVQEFTIDVRRDTVLITQNGAMLKIPKGSLETTGNTVTLEIKEAYSLMKMIQAGLVTQSNGQPLSSGGMIYINNKEGQEVKFRQAISVALPADHLDSSMKLFRGVKDENGNINWTDPAPLPENTQLLCVQRGQKIFQSKCASCHAIGRVLTAPDLAHIIKRFRPPGEDNYRYYEHGFYSNKTVPTNLKPDADSLVVHREYDHFYPLNVYKCGLTKMFGVAADQRIRTVDTSAVYHIDDVYLYVQNESDRLDLPLPSHAYLKDCADSCAVYERITHELQKRKADALKRKSDLIKENGEMVDEPDRSPQAPIAYKDTVPEPVDYDVIVTSSKYNAEYYQFTIEAFGWYNIDVLLKDINGVKESELFVRLTGEFTKRVEVYLIIPSVNVYAAGGPAERNTDEFAFYLKNGKLPLPQDTKAWILAVTETRESVAYAIKEFTTSAKQEFEIALTAVTKEEFNAALSKLPFNGMNVTVAESKFAAGVRNADIDIDMIEKDLENTLHQLRPKNCDCDCITTDVTTGNPESVQKK